MIEIAELADRGSEYRAIVGAMDKTSDDDDRRPRRFARRRRRKRPRVF
jgi:hypothetical protein